MKYNDLWLGFKFFELNSKNSPRNDGEEYGISGETLTV